MSESTDYPHAETGKQNSGPVPRAVVHKQILDVAEAHPDATVETLASRVSGASTGLVKRVLNEYGDPVSTGAQSSDEPSKVDGSTAKGASPLATDESTAGEDESTAGEDESTAGEDESTAGDEGSAQHNHSTTSTVGDTPLDSTERSATDDGSASTAHVTVSELSEKQWATLRAIYERPGATQHDLADHFDVTAPTINKRLNTIDGFDWDDRVRLVTNLFGEDTGPADTDPADRSTQALAASLDELANRVGRIEQQLDECGENSRNIIDDPELLQKIMHACLRSDQITEDEELRIFESLLDFEAPRSG